MQVRLADFMRGSLLTCIALGGSRTFGLQPLRHRVTLGMPGRGKARRQGQPAHQDNMSDVSDHEQQDLPQPARYSILLISPTSTKSARRRRSSLAGVRLRARDLPPDASPRLPSAVRFSRAQTVLPTT